MQTGKGLRAPKLCRRKIAQPEIREQQQRVLWLSCGHPSLGKLCGDRTPLFIGQTAIEQG
jgi:hypothetical protein